jgi:hypothetical protein
VHFIPRLIASLAILPSALCAHAQGADCPPPQEPTFTVHLPKLGFPPDEEGEGWPRPRVWQHHPNAVSDSITVPNGRPIYALIVSGYASNRYLDEMMVYNFARHLQAQGAYVHYSWWNNLLAPYMERPLHHSQSHPGDLSANALDFISAEQAGRKAVPAEDYQFVADAKRFLTAIRENNPSAIIIVVGHSMGGGATVHLASQTDVLLDIVAPIDPVGNRNFPWSGSYVPGHQHFNWTRWRVSRDNFLGYRRLKREGFNCVPVGPWLPDATDTDNALFCKAIIESHDAPTLIFGFNVVNLYHRYQKEALFPFDFKKTYHFGHFQPTNGSTTQSAVAMKDAWSSFLVRTPDPGGWPAATSLKSQCCFTGDGVGWAADGHGEIVGYRGPLPDPIPLGVRMRTSPRCGENCGGLTWPTRSRNDSEVWSNGNGTKRRDMLIALENIALQAQWKHRPINAGLCRVSQGLINLFNDMNKPPVAEAGPDVCAPCSCVTLDGSCSSDPDNDLLEYEWTWDGGSAEGVMPTICLPHGTTCITLTVRDPSGHIAIDAVSVTVQ